MKIDGFESRRRNSGLLHILIGFFLILKVLHYYSLLEAGSIFPVLPFFFVAALSIAYGFFRKRIDTRAKYNYWLRLLQVVSFTFLGVAFVKTGASVDYILIFIFSFLTILLMFSERRIFMETVIVFDETGFRIPGYYRDHLVKWEDLSQVTVREDFVTLFHRKGKYLQYQVNQDLSTLEVAKMNAFCREHTEHVAEAAEIN